MANIIWALSTQIDIDDGVITIDMELAECLTLGEYVQNYFHLHITRVDHVAIHIARWPGVGMDTEQGYPALGHEDEQALRLNGRT